MFLTTLSSKKLINNSRFGGSNFFVTGSHLAVRSLFSELSKHSLNNRSLQIKTILSNNTDAFYQWLVGFIEAEGCFKIKPKYRNKLTVVHSFYFEFEIHLHVDDKKVLNFICETLGLGKIYVRSNSCSWIIGNEKGLRVLLDILDRYPMNGIKLLDYKDFKEAFFLYFDRIGTLNEDLISKILNLKEGMNKGRTEFNMPDNHQIKITDYWLLGLIEGEGTFSIAREKFRPIFQLLFTAAQRPLLEEIKNYLINNLGFDRFSLWKLNNSSIIGIYEMKPKGNSKPTVCLEIRNINVLHNYFIPFLTNLSFLTKKGLDFADFTLICKALYAGAHKNSTIKELILKLSLGMNDFRLSTNKEASTINNTLTSEELALLEEVGTPLREDSPMLSSDKVEEENSKDLSANLNNKVVYLIIMPDKKELIAASLKEASDIIGLHSSTLSRLLESSYVESEGVEVKNHLIRRIKIFNTRYSG